MNCPDAGLALTDYLYGDLPAGERLPLERHVAECGACAQQLAQMRSVVGWLDEADTPSAAISPLPILVRQTAALQRDVRRWRIGAVGALAAAAAILIAVSLLDFRWEQQGLVIAVRPGFQPAAPVVEPKAPGLELANRGLEQRVEELTRTVQQLQQQVRQSSFVSAVQEEVADTFAFEDIPN